MVTFAHLKFLKKTANSIPVDQKPTNMELLDRPGKNEGLSIPNSFKIYVVELPIYTNIRVNKVQCLSLRVPS